MIITAALCWYDESVEFLARCVQSLEGLADSVVAVDGAWAIFPGGPRSGAEQVEAIKETADAVGMACHVWQPDEIWASQVAKRAAMMDLASDIGDWLFVIDADEYVNYALPLAVRRRLQSSEAVTATVTIKNLHRGEQMPGYHPQGGLTRRFYRAGTTVTVVHSGYAYEGRHLLRDELEEDLRDLIVVEHDNHNRGADRNAADRGYREARQREGVEVWV